MKISRFPGGHIIDIYPRFCGDPAFVGSSLDKVPRKYFSLISIVGKNVPVHSRMRIKKFDSLVGGADEKVAITSSI